MNGVKAMNRSETERLLRKVFDDTGDQPFRVALYQQALDEFRRKPAERPRSAFPALAATIAFIMTALLTLAVLLMNDKEITDMRTESLSTDQIVETSSWNDIMVTTSITPEEIVETKIKLSDADLLSDQELLGMFEGHPTALIQVGSENKKLIFLEPSDEVHFFGGLESDVDR